MHKHPLTITFVGRDHPDLLKWIENPDTTVIRAAGADIVGIDVRIPGLIQAAGYASVFSAADEMDRPCVVVGILARHTPSTAPWCVEPARGREDLAALGARALEAAWAKGYHPDDVISAGYTLFGRARAAMTPPSAEAIKAAEDFSQGPTANGTPSGASSPTDTKDPPSVGSS